MPYLILLLFYILTLCLLKFFFSRFRLYKLASKIPGTNGYPLVGDLPRFFNIDKNKFIDTAFDQMDENSSLTKIWMGPKLILMTENPDAIHTIFNSPHCLNKPELFYNGLSATKGLLPLTGELYPKHRKLLNRAFMPAILQKIHPIIDEMCKKLVMKIEKDLGKEVNILHYVGACALESFGRAQFDYSSDFYGSPELDLVDESMDLAMERVVRLWMNFLPDFVFQMTKLGRDLKKIVNYGNEYRKKTEEVYKVSKEKNYEAVKNRVVDVLLDPANKFSDIEIRDEFIIFVMGSYDTTAKTTSILLLMLAIHQDVQHKLIAEIDKICNENKNFTIDVDFLKKFEYMELVLKEAMRLFPAGPSVARVAGEEIEVGGYKVPRDSIFLISIMRMQRNPKYWGSDAHLFKPERFLDESLNPRAFVPFSGGKRLCIGYRYANIFIKTLLINFFRNYRVETKLKYEDLKVLLGVTINIQQGCMITVRKRKKN